MAAAAALPGRHEYAQDRSHPRRAAHQGGRSQRRDLRRLERGSQGAIDLPWADASALAADHVRALLDRARMAIVVSTEDRAGIFAPVTRTGCRLAVDAPRRVRAPRDRERPPVAKPTVVASRQRADAARPRATSRLARGRRGPRWAVPAGPPGKERRWAITAEDGVARSLHDVARTLFWFHAVREGMPDASATWAYRPPLRSPFHDPGDDLVLSAGRFVVGRPLADVVPDAEIALWASRPAALASSAASVRQLHECRRSRRRRCAGRVGRARPAAARRRASERSWTWWATGSQAEPLSCPARRDRPLTIG